MVEPIFRIASGFSDFGTDSLSTLGRQSHTGKASSREGRIEIVSLGDLHTFCQPQDFWIIQPPT